MSADIDLKGSEREKPSPDNAASLFVSLYVVILAFFILLAANAQFDVEKTKSVMDSVNKAFSIEVLSETDMRINSIGDEVSVTQFFEDMQKSLQSVVPLEEMQVITDGQQMIITMHSTALFNRDDPNLRYDRRRFYHRLSETLTKWREGNDMHLTMVQGVKKPVSGSANASTTLEITRAGNFARFMENRGVAPHDLLIAIEQNNPDTISLIFDVVEFDPSKLDFKQITPDATSPPAVPSGAISLESLGGGAQ